MLRQEINLYRTFEAPVTNAALLTWQRYWILNIAVTILFFIIFIGTMIENHFNASKLIKQQTALNEYKSEFEKLRKSFPQLFFSDNINEAVKKFKTELATQEEVINILLKHIPFSENLRGLSRAITPNVWLTGILIDKHGNHIILKGDSYGIKSLHQFISSLDDDKIYTNYSSSLNHVENTNVTDPNTRLTFEINLDRDDNK